MLRKIIADVIVPADLRQVWEAWTTEEGAKTFLHLTEKSTWFPAGLMKCILFYLPLRACGVVRDAKY
ncbi:MAG TPA: hypothetical protein DF984_05130 [Anaerolineaceae bacterium]|jgi:hypothetical protein|nr:hypothetical protein [Anaerolineaceae bacterium]